MIQDVTSCGTDFSGTEWENGTRKRVTLTCLKSKRGNYDCYNEKEDKEKLLLRHDGKVQRWIDDNGYYLATLRGEIKDRDEDCEQQDTTPGTKCDNDVQFHSICLKYCYERRLRALEKEESVEDFKIFSNEAWDKRYRAEKNIPEPNIAPHAMIPGNVAPVKVESNTKPDVEVESETNSGHCWLQNISFNGKPINREPNIMRKTPQRRDSRHMDTKLPMIQYGFKEDFLVPETQEERNAGKKERTEACQAKCREHNEENDYCKTKSKRASQKEKCCNFFTVRPPNQKKRDDNRYYYCDLFEDIGIEGSNKNSQTLNDDATSGQLDCDQKRENTCFEEYIREAKENGPAGVQFVMPKAGTNKEVKTCLELAGVRQIHTHQGLWKKCCHRSPAPSKVNSDGTREDDPNTEEKGIEEVLKPRVDLIETIKPGAIEDPIETHKNTPIGPVEPEPTITIPIEPNPNTIEHEEKTIPVIDPSIDPLKNKVQEAIEPIKEQRIDLPPHEEDENEDNVEEAINLPNEKPEADKKWHNPKPLNALTYLFGDKIIDGEKLPKILTPKAI
jgi:hypothetical protein